MMTRIMIKKAVSGLEIQLYQYVKEQLSEVEEIEVDVKLTEGVVAEKLILNESGEPVVVADDEDLEFWGLELEDMLLIFKEM